MKLTNVTVKELNCTHNISKVDFGKSVVDSRQKCYAGNMEKLKKVLGNLEISSSAQIVYLSLLSQGEATARVLAQRTGVTRPSVYDQVKELRSRDLVVERTIEGKTYFAVADVRKLESLMDEKIEDLKEDQKELKFNLPSLIVSAQSVQPKIRFFEGADGIQQLLKDVLWYDNITLSVYWSHR